MFSRTLMNKTRDLVTQDSEKAKVLNEFFALSFTSKTNLQEFQVPKTERLEHVRCIFVGKGTGQGILYTFSKYVDYMKLGGMPDSPEL